ncbi:hypothetical protein Zm00014a_002426 [Zea mays]|jgi:hypothetical protein|uniref:Uncharacterized protein n=1 Tax=Zea mays TaxID=4577 RepID=A0A317Y362_MAIZE|nr:hypothetical protein Zm00014a_002426 [Zea mays]
MTYTVTRSYTDQVRPFCQYAATQRFLPTLTPSGPAFPQSLPAHHQSPTPTGPRPSWRQLGGRRCRPTPGAEATFRPLAGDEHQCSSAPPVTPTPCLPFLLFEAVYPNPNLVFILGSDLISSVYGH